MSAKKTAGGRSREAMRELDHDKENKGVYANLRVNNLDKNLKDAHLYQLSKQHLLTERLSPPTTQRTTVPFSGNQTAHLMELLKEEVEQKFRQSQTNRLYRLPRKRLLEEDSERSIQSLEGVERYHLADQNKGEGELETLLTKLVNVVSRTPEAGHLLTQKHTNSHRLFCQLLKNVAIEKEGRAESAQKSARLKKSKEKTSGVNIMEKMEKREKPERLKISSQLNKTSTQLTGRIHLKSRCEILGTIPKTSRREVSPTLIPSQSFKNLKEPTYSSTTRDLAHSNSGKLHETRQEKVTKKRPTKGTGVGVKTITTTSFANSGFKSSAKSSISRRQSPEESNSRAPAMLSSKLFAPLRKKLALTSRVRHPQG